MLRACIIGDLTFAECARSAFRIYFPNPTLRGLKVCGPKPSRTRRASGTPFPSLPRVDPGAVKRCSRPSHAALGNGATHFQSFFEMAAFEPFHCPTLPCSDMAPQRCAYSACALSLQCSYPWSNPGVLQTYIGAAFLRVIAYAYKVCC